MDEEVPGNGSSGRRGWLSKYQGLGLVEGGVVE